MKSPRKRLSALLLALAMTFSLLPLSAWAEELPQAEEPKTQDTQLIEEEALPPQEKEQPPAQDEEGLPADDGEELPPAEAEPLPEEPAEEEPVPEEPLDEEPAGDLEAEPLSDLPIEVMTTHDATHEYVEDLDGADSGAVYIIWHGSRILYSSANGDINQLRSSTQNGRLALNQGNFDDGTQTWKIVSATGGFVIQNVGNSRYLTVNNDALATTDSTNDAVWTITLNEAKTGYTIAHASSGKKLAAGSGETFVPSDTGAVIHLYKQTDFPTIPGYTRVTSTDLDTSRKHLIVSQDSQGNLYAIKAAASTSGPGGLTAAAAAPTFAAKLSIDEDTVTAAMVGQNDTLSSPQTGADVDMSALLFTVTGSGTTYQFYNEASKLYLNVNSKLFLTTQSDMTVAIPTGTGMVTLTNVHGTNETTRHLDFNKAGDPREYSNANGTYGTDFWGPTDTKFPIYLFASNETTTPTELTIEGYTQVKTLADLTDGHYLIVASAPDGYYVLYPGKEGSSADADNVRKLTVDQNLRATGWTKRDANRTFTVEDAEHPFSAAENAVKKNGSSYSITAGAYGLFATGNVYGTSGTSAVTVEKGAEDFFRMKNSGGSYLIYYAPSGNANNNFNQGKNPDSYNTYHPDLLLFKADDPQAEKPAVTPANALPGYTWIETVPGGGLDETRYYMFVALDQNKNLYALRHDVTTSPGDPNNGGTVRLTATADSFTAHTIDVSGAPSATAVSEDKLLFSVESVTGGKYQFHGKTGDNGLMLTNTMVGTTPSDLTVQPSTSTHNQETGTGKGFDIATCTGNQDRHLSFNVKGATGYAQYPDYPTGFFGPKGVSYISVYLYAKDGETAPTAWQRLQDLITKCEALNEKAYTKATWPAFAEKLQAATAVKETDGNETIKAALAALTAAKEALQLAPVVPENPTATVYVRDTDGLDDGAVYAIFTNLSGDSNNRILYHTGSGKTDKVGGATATETINGSRAETLALASGFAAGRQLWKAVRTGDGWAFQSVDSGRWLDLTAASTGNLNTSAEAKALTVTQSGGAYTLSGGGNYLAYTASSNGVFSTTTAAASAASLRLYKETEVELGDESMVKDWRTLVPASSTTRDQPFPSGTAGSDNFRIPAIITLKHQTGDNASKNGRLVAAIDARWNHTGDACSLDTILSYSDDNGENWTYLFPNYFGDSTDVKAGHGTAFIDPEIVEAENGDIYIMTDVFPGGVALNTAPMGAVASTGYAEITNNGVTAKRLVLYTSPEVTQQGDDNYSYYVDAFDESGFATIRDVTDHSDSGFYVDEYYYLYKQKGDTRNAGEDKIYCQQLGSTKYVQQNVFFYNASLHVRCACYLWIVKSTDGGETWGDPIMVNDQVRTKTPPDRFYGVGPGAGLSFVDASGKNVIMLTTYTWSTEIAGFIYSCDNGVTWHRGPNATTARSSESCLVQLNNTTVRHFFRDNNTTVHYADHTWNPTTETWTAGELKSTTAPKQGGFGCQLSAIRYSEPIDGKTAFIVSTPADASSRTNGKLYVLLADDATGETTLGYTYEVTPSGAPYAYSSLTETADGDIALLYEVSGASVPCGHPLRGHCPHGHRHGLQGGI